MILDTFKCTNIKCKAVNEVIEAWVKPGDAPECKKCKKKMGKVWFASAIKTGDGYKS